MPSRSHRASTRLSYLAELDKIKHFISFNDFKGFKKISDISEHYEMQSFLGKGTFG